MHVQYLEESNTQQLTKTLPQKNKKENNTTKTTYYSNDNSDHNDNTGIPEVISRTD